MYNHLHLTDSEFENQFQSCTLLPSLFTHEAHLRLVWIHIKKYGIEQALKKIPKQLLHFVENLGAQDKYNHTLTVAAIKVVYHFILKSKSDNFIDFITAFPRLKNNFKELLACHYEMDIFNNEQAKQQYLEPDILPFD